MIVASIILPTYNNSSSLGETLETLVFQDYPADKYEIIIVDNGSTDETEVVSRGKILKFPNHKIKYFYEPEPGSLAARHYGVFKSVGELLIFVDDDIDADHGWLSSIISTFDDSTIQLVGGKNLPKFEVLPPDWLSSFFGRQYNGYTCGPLSLLDFGEDLIDIHPNFIWTLNFSIRRNVFFDLRGFHPNIYPNYLQHYQGDGEGGLTLKAYRKNCRSVYQPKALVYHRIPKERLTFDYFERRAFFAGVSTSFTKTRNLFLKEHDNLILNKYSNIQWAIKTLKHPYFHLRNNIRLLLSNEIDNSESINIKTRVWKARYSGFKFHQKALKNSPNLLNWVVKKDYWDYRLPDDKASKIGVGSKCRRSYFYYNRLG